MKRTHGGKRVGCGASRIASAAALAGALWACADPQPTSAPSVASDVLLGKPWSGDYASTAGSYLTSAIQVNNNSNDPSIIRIRRVSSYSATISFANTLAAGTANCVANNTRVSATALLSLLSDASKVRDDFEAIVALPKLGMPASAHTVRATWNVPDTMYTVQVGTNGNSGTLYPTVDLIPPNVYRFSGGTVSIRANYANSRFTVLTCPMVVDVVDLTYPGP